VLLAEAQLRSDNPPWQHSLGRAKELDPANPGIWFARLRSPCDKAKPEQAVGASCNRA